MQTAHEIINAFAAEHSIDWSDFQERFGDAGFPAGEVNYHDSRYLEHLKTYVEERNSDP